MEQKKEIDLLTGAIFQLFIPAAYALMNTSLGLNSIWWVISVSSILKGIVLTVWFVIELRKLLKKEKLA